MSEPVEPLDFVMRLLLAAAAGLVVGWEREVRNRPAGLRTHILVAVGACAFALIGIDLYQWQEETSSRGFSDVVRIVSGVATGVGFLGAGAIIQGREEVHGLTTAAGIWVVSAAGIAAAIANYWILGTTVGITIFVLVVLRYLERRLFHGREDRADDRRQPR